MMTFNDTWNYLKENVWFYMFIITIFVFLLKWIWRRKDKKNRQADIEERILKEKKNHFTYFEASISIINNVWCAISLYNKFRLCKFIKYEVLYNNEKIHTHDQEAKNTIKDVKEYVCVQVKRCLFPASLTQVKCTILLYFSDMIGTHYMQEFSWNLVSGAISKEPIEISETKFKNL